jgi:predicted O-methyltransferase YrrM
MLSRRSLYRARFGKEYFTPKFLEILESLNKTVRESQEVIEGNYFYHHQVTELQNLPDPSRSEKRVFLSGAVKGKRNVLEVGFNAGHSALLILSSNPQAKYLGVDIGEHSYTAPAATVLKHFFGVRFELVIADSRTFLNELVFEKRKFDLIHVDGDHSYQSCLSDLRKSAKLMKNSRSRILLDDILGPEVEKAYLQFKSEVPIVATSSRENLLIKVIRDNPKP